MWPLSSSRSTEEEETGSNWRTPWENLEQSKNFRERERETKNSKFYCIACSRLGRELEVYCGTHGLLKYPDSSKTLREIYLADKYIPVPEYFWMVVQDKVRQEDSWSPASNVLHSTLKQPPPSLASTISTPRSLRRCFVVTSEIPPLSRLIFSCLAAGVLRWPAGSAGTWRTWPMASCTAVTSQRLPASSPRLRVSASRLEVS